MSRSRRVQLRAIQGILYIHTDAAFSSSSGQLARCTETGDEVLPRVATSGTHSLTHPVVRKSTKRLKRCLAGPRGAADVLAEHAGVEDQNEDTVGV